MLSSLWVITTSAASCLINDPGAHSVHDRAGDRCNPSGSRCPDRETGDAGSHSVVLVAQGEHTPRSGAWVASRRELQQGEGARQGTAKGGQAIAHGVRGEKDDNADDNEPGDGLK